MKVPAVFPDGCTFLESEPGNQFVVFPGGAVFWADPTAGGLREGSLPKSEPFLSSEEALRFAAAKAAE